MSVMAVLAALVTRPLAAAAPMPASFSTFDLQLEINFQYGMWMKFLIFADPFHTKGQVIKPSGSGSFEDIGL